LASYVLGQAGSDGRLPVTVCGLKPEGIWPGGPDRRC
jgi:hypothetical protein